MSYAFLHRILLFYTLFFSFFPATKAAVVVPEKRSWNFKVWMSNNNNLHRFGMANFRQMMQVGSTPNMNLLLQMDSLGQREVSRFYIENNNAKLIETHTNTATSFSGNPVNLYEFARWGSTSYPADKTCLVLWNHGAGIKDPNIWGRMLMNWRDDLFVVNPQTGLLEINRQLSSRAAKKEFLQKRGIAFNEAAEAYLTNDDLKNSLEAFCADCLGGKKINILPMDACHMSMVEVGSQIKNSVSIMVGSQEVEPGAGWDYQTALAVFNKPAATDREIATHFVSAYSAQYKGSMGDYTQSAVDLSFCDSLEANISRLSNALVELMATNGQHGFKIIRDVRFSRTNTTEFFDNDYIDLGHLYKSLHKRAQAVVIDGKFNFFAAPPLPEPELAKDACVQISAACVEGLDILQKMVIANAVGRNLKEASGLSIYFPISSIHQSYSKTVFAQNTTWAGFLEKFIRMRFKKDHTENALATTAKKGESMHPVAKEPCCSDCADTGGHCADDAKTKQLTEKQKRALRHGTSLGKKGPCPCDPKKRKPRALAH